MDTTSPSLVEFAPQPNCIWLTVKKASLFRTLVKMGAGGAYSDLME